MAATKTSATAVKARPESRVITASKMQTGKADGRDELKAKQPPTKKMKLTAEPKAKFVAAGPKSSQETSSVGSKKRKEDAGEDEPQSNGRANKKVKRDHLATKTAAMPHTIAKPGAKKSAGTSSWATSIASNKETTGNGSDKENAGVIKNAASARGKANGTAAKKSGKKQDDEKKNENTAKEKAPAKRLKMSPAPAEPAAKKRAVRRKAAAINRPPTEVLDVFVFGEGGNGELGLGNTKIDGKKPRHVKRPRLNPYLAAATARVVQIACGGMHTAVLTADNKILTWGVNDMGALGRETAWDGGLRDVDDEDDEDDNDYSAINPRESTPGEVDMSEVEEDTIFVQVVASDNATFALTAEGRVYGWGTFRNDEGILGFDKATSVQRVPRLMPKPLEKITQLAAGSNHVLALDAAGKVYTWGSGQHDQLGRKTIVKREAAHNSQYTGEEGLTPAGLAALPGKRNRGEAKTVPRKIACGAYHSFIVDNHGRVYSWGLNNYGELGNADDAGTDNASSPVVRLVESLSTHKIADIDGGEHHSLACTEDGKLITWGRIDGHQTGLKEEDFTEENTIFDDRNRPRILKKPTVVPDLPFIKSVAGGTDHNIALSDSGKAYSWGFSATLQTGQGTEEDIEVPTLIDNSAVRNCKLVFAGAGGQFSILASVAEPPAVNGTS